MERWKLYSTQLFCTGTPSSLQERDSFHTTSISKEGEAREPTTVWLSCLMGYLSRDPSPIVSKLSLSNYMHIDRISAKLVLMYLRDGGSKS